VVASTSAYNITTPMACWTSTAWTGKAISITPASVACRSPASKSVRRRRTTVPLHGLWGSALPRKVEADDANWPVVLRDRRIMTGATNHQLTHRATDFGTAQGVRTRA
jgi:hypothetical protein